MNEEEIQEQGAAGAPTDLDEVADSLLDTVLGIWADFIEHLPYLVAGIFILLLTWLIASSFKHFSQRLLGGWVRRPSLRELVSRLITIAIWLLGLLIAALVLFPGLTPAKALGALGLVSIAVGFAFRDIFENFFAGILILWRYPFENGDFIECSDIVGKVEDITIRMSMIRKTTGELVVVPNSVLFKNPVEVLTDKPKRRVTIIAGVAYGEDVGQSVEVIENAVKHCSSVDKEKPIQVFPQGFGASSIDIEVTWWTDPKPVDIRRSRGEIVTAVKKALDEAGIEIPFPYRTLTFKEPLALRRLSTADAAADS